MKFDDIEAGKWYVKERPGQAVYMYISKKAEFSNDVTRFAISKYGDYVVYNFTIEREGKGFLDPSELGDFRQIKNADRKEILKTILDYEKYSEGAENSITNFIKNG